MEKQPDTFIAWKDRKEWKVKKAAIVPSATSCRKVGEPRNVQGIYRVAITSRETRCRAHSCLCLSGGHLRRLRETSLGKVQGYTKDDDRQQLLMLGRGR